MYDWLLTMRVEECRGVKMHSDCEYTIIGRLENHFTVPSLPAQIHQNIMIFSKGLTLNFQTPGNQLPSQNILLIMNESLLSPRGVATKKQQIIGIATIRISYPLSKECATPTAYKFQKAIDNKATIVASFNLSCTQVPQQARNKKTGIQKQEENILANGSEERRIVRQQKLSMINWSEVNEENANDEKYEEILKERNELYRMSEDLYEQLKKCLNERDEYLRDLREKELSQQQIKEQLQFLKLKIQQYQSAGNDHNLHQMDNQQIEQLRRENYNLMKQIEQKSRQMKELERKVKESMRAMQEFKKQALMAQSELIHKQSQASFLMKKKRFMDPVQCIQELYKQLQNRRIEDMFYFTSNEISTTEQSLQSIIEMIRKDTVQLFSQLLPKTKLQKDKQWLLQQKMAFEKKLKAYLSQS